jgi:hypothetical protein
MTSNTEDGLQIVLSPMQLAAILEGQTLDRGATVFNRLWGALTVVGGAIELVGSAGLLLTPEPTMVTKASGFALGAHGSDTLSTGLQQVWTGRPRTTMTAQAVAAAARNLGVDPDTAGKAGMYVDIAVPIIAGFAGLVRVLEVRRGVAILEESEGMRGLRPNTEGHTIQKHVGKDQAYLQGRLAAKPRMEAASTFHTVEQAGLVVSKALKANRLAIKQWARTAPVGTRMPKPLVYDSGEIIGQGFVRITGQMQDMTKVQIIIEKTQQTKKLYFIVSAHPTL